MLNIKHLVPIEDLEIFKKCLSEADGFQVKEEPTDSVGLVQFELIFEDLYELYYLGQMVGVEKGRRLTEKIFNDLKEKVSTEDLAAKIKYLMLSPEDADSVEKHVVESGGKLWKKSDRIRNETLKKEFVIVAIEFEAASQLFLLGKLVGAEIPPQKYYDMIYSGNIENEVQ